MSCFGKFLDPCSTQSDRTGDTAVGSMDGVRVFLDNINMGKYWGVFKTKGYDREDDVMGLDEDDMDQMGIANEDRNMMLEAGMHAEVRRR